MTRDLLEAVIEAKQAEAGPGSVEFPYIRGDVQGAVFNFLIGAGRISADDIEWALGCLGYLDGEQAAS